MRRNTLQSVVVDRIEISPSGCWLWSDNCDVRGYGTVTFERKSWRVHRLLYTLLINPDLGDLVLHHGVCTTPRCCNPLHLEPLTKEQHDAISDNRLRCRNGHTYTPDNTLYWGDGRRRCKNCQRDRLQRRVERGEFRKRV